MKKELILWHEFDGPGDTSIEVLEGICRDFEAESGIVVKPEVMNITVLVERLTKLKEQSHKPDIAFVPSDMTGYAALADYTEVPERLWSGIMDEAVLQTMRLQDKQYGIPIVSGNHLVVFYNKEWYPEAPVTWQDYERVAEQAHPSFVPLATDLVQGFFFIPFLTAFHGWPMKEGSANFDTPECKNALRFVKTKLSQGMLGNENGSTSLLEKFFAGDIGAIICGEWIFNYVSQHMGDRLGVTELPVIEGGKAISMTSSVGLVFPNQSLQSAKREDIIRFVQYMLEPTVQVRWESEVLRTPARNDLGELLEPIVTENKRKVSELMKDCRPMSCDPIMMHIWEAMCLGLEAFIERQLSEEEAIAVMVQAFEKSTKVPAV
ncbi:sugar ABC transporter substrate-binding protein [Marinicrinis sediminis]|uniref:Extracellular solute-binding protein n=1 Tax=Marinicrinis sediminis TaxID=1652465 RepID=A0ABW5R8W9_9BACL